jgi:hypothetical protein
MPFVRMQMRSPQLTFYGAAGLLASLEDGARDPFRGVLLSVWRPSTPPAPTAPTPAKALLAYVEKGALRIETHPETDAVTAPVFDAEAFARCHPKTAPERIPEKIADAQQMWENYENRVRRWEEEQDKWHTSIFFRQPLVLLPETLEHRLAIALSSIIELRDLRAMLEAGVPFAGLPTRTSGCFLFGECPLSSQCGQASETYTEDTGFTTGDPRYWEQWAQGEWATRDAVATGADEDDSEEAPEWWR